MLLEENKPSKTDPHKDIKGSSMIYLYLKKKNYLDGSAIHFS